MKRIISPQNYARMTGLQNKSTKEVVFIGNLPTAYECAVACREKLAPIFYYSRNDVKGGFCGKSGCSCFCHLNTPSKCVKEDSPFYDLYTIKAGGNFIFVLCRIFFLHQ